MKTGSSVQGGGSVSEKVYKGRAAKVAGARKGARRSPWRGASLSNKSMRRAIENGFVPEGEEK